MNKKRVNIWISKAYDAIIDSEIATKNETINRFEVVKSFRGQISSFGAAIVMGSLKSAVAFYSSNGKAKTDRAKLLIAIYKIIKAEEDPPITNDNVAKVFAYICEKEKDPNFDIRGKVIDASIAIKLAMNLFYLSEVKK